MRRSGVLYTAISTGFLTTSAFPADKLVLVAGGDKANFKEPFGLDFLPHR